MARVQALRIAIAIFMIAAAAIAGAFAFQASGYIPCELCLKERIPYYAGMAAALLALVLAIRGQRRLLSASFGILLLVFIMSAALGAYHSGVEWGFWPGPNDCTGAIGKASSMQEFRYELNTIKVVRCDAAAIRIFGLSLAGWNAMISVALVGLAALGLVRSRRI